MQGNGSNGLAIIYAAKSSPDERGSIPDQIKRCRELAETESYEVVHIYDEENVSAYNDDRGPELAAALEHAARIGAALLVWHSDRLARGDGEKNRHLVEILLDAMRNGFRLRSVEDDATFASLSSAAQMGDRNHEDSRRKSGAVREGLARRRAQGKRTGGNSYALTWRRNENDERETIPDPERAPIVDRIYAEYLEGRSLLQIVKGLNADHVPTQRGGKWSAATVSRVLENPVYAGMVRDGDRLIDAQFEAIISRERYFEALRLRKTRKQTHKRGRQPVGQHLFRQGFLRHGECGGGMSPRTERNKDGTLRERYRCNTHYASPTDCDLTMVPRAPIDMSVYHYFVNVGLDLEETRAQIIAASEQKVAEIGGLHASAQDQAARARERLERVKGDYLAGELTANEWRELRAEVEPAAAAADRECERLASQLQAAEADPTLAGIEAGLLERLAGIRAALAGQVTDAAGVDAVRAALMRVFDRFVLHKGRAEGRANLDLIGDGYWIEPITSEEVIAALAGKRQQEAENNFNRTFVLENPVISPISA
ncbi:MAG TPA: recombinase family protein [Solirubrobacterales bacterium]